MFRDLVRTHFKEGPFKWDWSNVPISIYHVIQLAENITENEDKYAKEYMPELGKNVLLYCNIIVEMTFFLIFALFSSILVSPLFN